MEKIEARKAFGQQFVGTLVEQFGFGKEAAYKMGVSPPLLYNIKSGRKSVSLSTFGRALKALEISGFYPEELVDYYGCLVANNLAAAPRTFSYRAKENIRKAKIGQPSPMKGRTHTPEAKRKIGNSVRDAWERKRMRT